jgi:hypothetical protein
VGEIAEGKIDRAPTVSTDSPENFAQPSSFVAMASWAGRGEIRFTLTLSGNLG